MKQHILNGTNTQALKPGRDTRTNAFEYRYREAVELRWLFGCFVQLKYWLAQRRKGAKEKTFATEGTEYTEKKTKSSQYQSCSPDEAQRNPGWSV